MIQSRQGSLNNDKVCSSLRRSPAVLLSCLLSCWGNTGADSRAGAVSKEVGEEAATSDCVAVASSGLDP